MRSAESTPCRSSTSGFSRSPSRSWPGWERDRLPSRSALSRFLAALTEEPAEALRTLFLDDLLGRPLTDDQQTGGLVDRAGNTWVVCDIDGTREGARQRALHQGEDLPPAFRRLDEICAAGYTGRTRGEVVRTRTTVAQAHSYQWLGSFGNRGNGRYREELRKGLVAIGRYLATHHLPQERTRLAARWTIWHGSRAFRCGWVRVCDARQRKSLARSSADSGAAGTYLPISSNNARKARRCAAFTIAPRSRWAPHVRASCTSSSSPTCRNRHLLPAMWSSCICIVGPLSQHFQTKTSSGTRTAGAVIRPGDRNAGK